MPYFLVVHFIAWSQKNVDTKVCVSLFWYFIDSAIHESESSFLYKKHFYVEKTASISRISDRFTSISLLTINSWYKMIDFYLD